MSTLVDSFSFHKFTSRLPALHRPEPAPPRSSSAPEEKHAAHQQQQQLANLASQHHRSKYNQLKFGPKGSPVIYVPVSIQTPVYFQKLLVLQSHSSFQAWYLCGPRQADKLLLGPGGSELSSPNIDLRDKISAAIASPLESRDRSASTDALVSMPRNTSQKIVKTSRTHPINISALVPPDHLYTLATFFNPPIQNSYPTLFDIPPSHTLDRIALDSGSLATTIPAIPPQINLDITPSPSCSELHPISEAIKVAINSGFTNLPAARKCRPDLGKDEGNPVIQSQSGTRLRPSPPPHLYTIALPEVEEFLAIPSSHQQTPPLVFSTSSTTEISAAPPLPASSMLQSAAACIGNLFLSSCPGKKVRLTGPAKGRNTVCRDLATDLHRMWEYGVRCIICCLDDGELAALGVPWEDYKGVAMETGLDILRIPTPEGLAPLSPATLDEQLHQVIERYTLKGADVLVHCRGGIGRAGVVAACWALKLGLCGWIETEVRGTGASGMPARNSGSYPVRRDTLHMVERIISVVRHRRSVKAIETYEQVHFLADYVEFLRVKGGACPVNSTE